MNHKVFRYENILIAVLPVPTGGEAVLVDGCALHDSFPLVECAASGCDASHPAPWLDTLAVDEGLRTFDKPQLVALHKALEEMQQQVARNLGSVQSAEAQAVATNDASGLTRE